MRSTQTGSELATTGRSAINFAGLVKPPSRNLYTLCHGSLRRPLRRRSGFAKYWFRLLPPATELKQVLSPNIRSCSLRHWGDSRHRRTLSHKLRKRTVLASVRLNSDRGVFPLRHFDDSLQLRLTLAL